MTEPIHIISLGAGVQSSTMALMAAKGEITPMPVAAIFADTRAEPLDVYSWLMWLKEQLPFPVVTVSHKHPLADYSITLRKTKDGRRYARMNIPLFVKAFKNNGFSWEVGKTNRKCTAEFKIEPVLNRIRETMAIYDSENSIEWLGISVDEISRAKESRHKWLEHRYPLIEMGMTRGDCLLWMRKNGFPKPPRSACVFCAFHSDSEWRRLKLEQPHEFQKAVEFEQELHKANRHDEIMRNVPFLHRSCKPLSEVDFSTEEERGQLNMFNNECEGMCGV